MYLFYIFHRKYFFLRGLFTFYIKKRTFLFGKSSSIWRHFESIENYLPDQTAFCTLTEFGIIFSSEKRFAKTCWY